MLAPLPCTAALHANSIKWRTVNHSQLCISSEIQSHIKHIARDTHTLTIILQLFWILSGTTRVSWYQKGKTNLDLLEQETVSGSDINWAICKSATCPRHRTMPAYHHSVFTGRMPFLPPNQQHQSTEGTAKETGACLYQSTDSPDLNSGFLSLSLCLTNCCFFPKF